MSSSFWTDCQLCQHQIQHHLMQKHPQHVTDPWYIFSLNFYSWLVSVIYKYALLVRTLPDWYTTSVISVHKELWMNTFIQDGGLISLVLHWHFVTVQRITDSSGYKMVDHELQLCFGYMCWSVFFCCPL